MTTNDPEPHAAARPAASDLGDDCWARIRHYALSLFSCDRHSPHGPDHWRRVETVGVELCAATGADETVVRLFAILHDVCRENDNEDPEHGPRAAELVGSLVGDLIPLDADRLALLEQAIRHHTDGHISDDPTIGTCWDADRLDLGRVWMTPEPALMSTEAGRRRAGGI